MEKKKQFSGWPDDCSPQQTEALQAFKKIVIEMNLSFDTYDDHYLLRFLRARKFNLVQTQKMWKDFINWRVKNNVDQIKFIKLPEIPHVRKCYPHGYHKVDKFSRPIYIERVGKLNIDELWKLTNEDRMLNYYTLSYQYLIKEIFPACTQHKLKQGKNDGKRVDQTLTILDLKSVSLMNANKAYKFVKPATKLAQDNYPEILGNMFIINAPMLFTGVWAMIKPWIDEKTTKKVKILGSSYKKELLQYINQENLPNFLDGGKCKCSNDDCLSWNIGPWNPQGKQIFETSLTQ